MRQKEEEEEEMEEARTDTILLFVLPIHGSLFCAVCAGTVC